MAAAPARNPNRMGNEAPAGLSCTETPAMPAGDQMATMMRPTTRPMPRPSAMPAVRPLVAEARAVDVATPVPVPARPLAQRRAQFESEALVHLDALYSFALKLTRARDDAEDLVSDTILRAFERWEQYRLGTNIRAWLFTILYHVFVSRKRRIDAREVQPIEQEDGWTGYEAVGEVDPEGKFYDSFLDESISQAIAKLPDEYRAAVVLSDVHQLRYAEIANILGVPEGTVKSRLFRGRRILQKKLAAYAVEMGYLKALPQAS
jgi:RNA polymerase sigma-70 factor, ECF subfamily